MSISDKAFEAALTIIEENHVPIEKGTAARDLHDAIRRYIVRCLWNKRQGTNRAPRLVPVVNVRGEGRKPKKPKKAKRIPNDRFCKIQGAENKC
jgi:hypothetical protein